jgi:hypothetical protein
VTLARTCTIAPSSASATISLAIPTDALTVHASPPALVTNRNPEHVGLTRRDLLDLLRDMRRNPSFADEVVMRGKIRGASPTAILAFLREQTAHASRPIDVSPVAANDAALEDEDDVEAQAVKVRRDLGLERRTLASRVTTSMRGRS